MEQTVFTIFNAVRMFVIATLSFFVAIAITPLWSRILFKYFRPGKEVERKDAPIFMSLHKKKEGTPVMGGVIVWFTVILLALTFWYFSKTMDGFWSRVNFLSRGETYLPLGFLLLAALVGMADDMLGIFKRKGLSIKKRLLIYTLVAIGGAWWFYNKLGWDFINIPFVGDVVIGKFYFALVFIFIIIATAFSANETDGLDGLSGGVFLTMFAAYAVIAFDQGKMDLVVFIAAIMGALIAFLWFNIYPAKFFMGDTGVMALGFTLGVIAVLTNTIFLLPFIAIIPLVESLSVIVQVGSKKIRKKKIFLSTPIHHHFEALGWPETQVTMRFWVVSAIGSIIGLIIFLVDSKIPPLFR
ncbi:MAG: phospho-N-acetylmuramoyl-pentapeptide-transferase [Candidatus Yanofskybacteria bacterium RIFCSPHIGHO2_01_FULL_45_42]|uniref:Phospho-N-acetylmuramoyl-pentapeptide-transferase n=3 Tax=Candidatus Yanofskyibacteriota TaxID=1752733 RepID=A0A1F8H257_9BACT|nr:MAG: phospho-N-acetylmuramoyl-pentapeptide-transferase [Candidatus Yanofskybacteria bacterium RIFCSPHIGHO2_01_FULL_45_42]OGN16534.1 MAG: phospho-N-acetylmuramoyl-pentapeptide-transferase [Candidatus Yanofskybacteria bacterium RIFCSPHIGHO2_02_FULL_46_19]OGN26438.1 MAG: phospho-N-acetylmuramoyl-pentapeptide-transferase [Candidatus Yanofskybacteria bacterium RIFCSPLOWO2_01_FULL_45_72]OGN31733.1 MAG: phospho-N-acetylmuramoyl-pentapeptide-transferase [Candidatus Yanofskybacteria bacterium RIFCSPLO